MSMNVTNFDKKCKCGPKFVCVRILENFDDLKVGSIYLPTTASANERLAHCIVEDVGAEAREKYGLITGDYVLIDRLSTFSHTAPVALLEYNSVIMKTNKDNTEQYPLKNMAFVDPDEKDSLTNVGGIVVPNYQDKLNVGTITAIGELDPDLKLEFKVGDKVMVTKGADKIQLNSKIFYIYKHDMLICKIEG